MECCWVFGGVERLEPNSENPFQEQEFDGNKCRMGEMFAVIVEKKMLAHLYPFYIDLSIRGQLLYLIAGRLMII